MSGFMGLRGLETPNPRDKERERREEHRPHGHDAMERRAEEKVQEILRDQQGDMSAYSGSDAREENENRDCGKTGDSLVGEIMSARIAVLSFDDNLLTVQGIFSKVKFRHLPVVKADGAIIGILSDRDLLRHASPFFGTVNEQSRDKEIMGRKIGTIMTRNPICVYTDTAIIDAVKLMNERKISCLPIVERGSARLLGIVTWKDVVRAFCPRAFNRQRESSRLKSGVRINPQSAESARLRARAAENSGPRDAMDGDSPANNESLRPEIIEPERNLRSPASTDYYDRLEGRESAANEAPQASRAAGSDANDLEAKQKALLREQLERTTDSARLRAIRAEQQSRHND